MNRLHRFGTALFHVGGVGAGISFLVLMNTFAAPALFWWAIIALAVCGVIAGGGYVLQHTFADPRRSERTDAEEADAEP